LRQFCNDWGCVLAPDAQVRSGRLCRALLFGLGLSISAFAHAVLAQERRTEFDIPAQAIDKALDGFGAASGFQVFYETALTAGRRSQPVKGTFDPTTALQLLLEGSGLTGRVIAADTITIVQANVIGPEQLQAKRAAFAYYGVMQAAVTAALCQSPETRPGPYRIAMQYWIDLSGQILRVRLIGSSGNEARDDAIVRAMQAVVLQPAASQLPQPVTLAIEPDEGGTPGICAPNGIGSPRVR
jgi:secretin/TonB-like protein/TonB-like protein